MSTGGITGIAGLTVLTPLRLERRAVRSGATSARVVVTGAGPARSREYRRVNLNGNGNGHSERGPVVVAGFAGGLHPDLEPGDLVVATEVRLADGATCSFPAARLLAGELQRAGLRAMAGPIRSVERLARGGAREQLAADGAVAVDMESGWLLEGYPLGGAAAVVRAVVDTARRELVSPWTPYGTWRAAQSLRAAMPVLERWADATRPPAAWCSPPRGASAPAWSGPSTSWSAPSTATARRSTSAARSSTTCTSSPSWPSAGPSSSTSSTRCPTGSRVVFAAHGVAPSVRDEAGDRDLQAIDATCPLVAKVHAEVRRFAGRGFQVLLIGHADHEEVEGTVGEAPDAITVVGHPDDVDTIEVADPDRVAYVTQTTLAVDDVAEVVARLRDRFPKLEGPPRDDICYATQNRQDAARALAQQCDLVLVVGSRNSSNSNRLVEVVRREGCEAHLVDDDGEVELAWLAGARTVGITAGASAPEAMVQRVVAALGALGPVEVEECPVVREDVRFTLPAEVR